MGGIEKKNALNRHMDRFCRVNQKSATFSKLAVALATVMLILDGSGNWLTLILTVCFAYIVSGEEKCETS